MGSNHSYAGGQSHQVPSRSQQVDQSTGDWKDGVGGSPHLKRFCQVVSPSIGRRGFARWIVTDIYYKSDKLFYLFYAFYIFIYFI